MTVSFLILPLLLRVMSNNYSDLIDPFIKVGGIAAIAYVFYKIDTAIDNKFIARHVSVLEQKLREEHSKISIFDDMQGSQKLDHLERGLKIIDNCHDLDMPKKEAYLALIEVCREYGILKYKFSFRYFKYWEF